MTETLDTEPLKESGTVSLGRSVPASVKAVWRSLMTKEGAEALLGEGAEIGLKGQTWNSINGKSGVIRSLHPLEQVRFSIRREDGKFGPSLVSVDLSPSGEATLITITHSNLTEDVDFDWLKSRWEAALDRISVHLAS